MIFLSGGHVDEEVDGNDFGACYADIDSGFPLFYGRRG